MTDSPNGSSNGPWWSNPVAKAVDFAAGQPFNNLLTAGILVAFGYGTYIGAPALWGGLERMQTSYIAAIKAEHEEFSKLRELERLECAKERELDREHINKMIDRLFARVGIEDRHVFGDIPSSPKHGPAEKAAAKPAPQ